EIKNFDRDEIRKWYNGYSWLGEEKVYNPHGILKLFSNKEFEYWWLEDGVPHYLYFYLIQKKVRPLQLENCLVSRQNLIKSNVENVKVKSLYFQSGFLSIQDKIRKNNRTYYRLDYPNFEVRESFNSGFWEYITQDRVDDECQNMLAKYLKNNEFEEFVGHLCAALEGVPYQWNPIEDSKSYFDYEYCYSRFLYAGLSSTNLDINAERSTIMGRCDFAVTYGDQVFIFELKMAKNKKERERMLDSAMKQIKTRRYGESYKKSKKLIHLIALVFGREEKNLIGWRHEMLI
ncbi:MAG: PD-(D/E)XK nuclease domain-containing protein, partial [Proteobacteria bacterium]|nr:PD-(D/E)XK nuclease domain-containing protein [Pseudomonadota bacterium]